MTINKESLVFDFAQRDPTNFAASLTQSSEEEINTVLNQLPNDVAASIIAKLPPQKAENILREDSSTLLKWIEEGSLEDAKEILIRLPTTRRKALVKKLPNTSHRLSLQRFLNYPRYSLGRYVSDQILTVSVEMATEDVINLIKMSPPGLPVVVTDKNSQYLGLLDARKVLEGNTDESIQKFINSVRPLTAESSIIDVMEVEQWRKCPQLAVVDHDGHVLGVVDQEQLHTKLNVSQEDAKPINSIFTLFNLFIKVLLKISESLFLLRSRS